MNYLFWLAIGMACQFAPRTQGWGVWTMEIVCIFIGSIMMAVLKALLAG